MRQIVLAFSFIIIVLAASGCTDNTPVQNKTYSAAGMSFVYPSTWNNSDPTSLLPYYGNSTPLVTVGDANNLLVIVYMASTPQVDIQKLQQLRSQVMSNVKTNRTNNTYVSDSDITIEGTNGLQLVMKDQQQNYITIITWMKNNKAYGLVLKSKDKNPEALNTIINTIKTP